MVSKKHAALTANVADTRRPTVIGADRHRGWHALRRVVARITTPLLPDDYLRLANPLWSARELRGRVIEVRRETPDSATLVIKPGWGFHFDYHPGQYVGIGVLVDGRWRWRSYSLTSSPVTVTGTISITVKAMPEGFLSSHLVDGVAPGTIVRLASPQGDFVLPDPPPAQVLFVTAGSGITPVMSMLRTLARRGDITDVVHLHSAPTADELLFADELTALAREHPGYRLLLRTTRDQGRLHLSGSGGAGTLDAEVPDWRQRETWACGPAALLADAERRWTAEGIADQLHIERFAVARTALGSGGTVTFAASGKTVVADAATTLLEAGESVGVAMPFGCRMGICQSCVVTLVDGAVRDLRSGADHEPGSRVQACVCVAAGDCELDV